MGQHDIFVIGASAGSVEALQVLVGTLPADLPAALFFITHVPARTKSYLPEILTRAGKLPAAHPVNGQVIEHGNIYVAPPDQHLLIERNHVHLSMGPKEQHHRPCINVTFRSAAQAHGERVAGIILTGELDDGTAGLWEIKRRGGIAIIQNPEDAAFPSMPISALREVEADYTPSLEEIGPLISRLASDTGVRSRIQAESDSMEARLTDLTCPDCRGTIWQVVRGNAVDFRCRVGHTYSGKTMLAEHFAAQEKALYGAIVALEEGASLARELSKSFPEPEKTKLRDEAHEREMQAEIVKRLLRERHSFSLDSVSSR